MSKQNSHRLFELSDFTRIHSEPRAMMNTSTLKSQLTRKDWRKVKKKYQRKKRRQIAAQLRDAQEEIDEAICSRDPVYLAKLEQEKEMELLREEQEELSRIENHQKWLALEAIAQKVFVEKSKRLEEMDRIQELERRRVEEEYNNRQREMEAQKLAKQMQEEAQIQRYLEFESKLDEYLRCGGVEVPEELLEIAETNPGKPLCGFFENIAACRYGDRCTRNHSRPGVTNTILIRNFFTHARLDSGKNTEYGSDSYLEYDDSELQAEYFEFFSDVVKEFEKNGIIKGLVTASNYEPHLRGNVYIEFQEMRDAVRTLKLMQGRFYASRQLNIEFAAVKSWPLAICGLSIKSNCPVGKACNFLHPFKNPNGKYAVKAYEKLRPAQLIPRNIGRDLLKRQDHWDDDDDKGTVKRNWRWSKTPERGNTERRRRSKSKERTRCDDDPGASSKSKHSRTGEKSHETKRGSDPSERSSSRSGQNGSRKKERTRDRSKSHKRKSKEKIRSSPKQRKKSKKKKNK